MITTVGIVPRSLWLTVPLVLLAACLKRASNDSAHSVHASFCERVTVRRQSHLGVPPRDSLEEGRRVTEARIDQVALAVAWYCQAHSGAIPTAERELLRFAESERVQGRSKCLVDSQLLFDAWGSALKVGWGREEVDVSTFGPDRKAGTGDDIGLMEPGSEGTEDIQVKTACSSP
jgi:hypothetical protein